MMCHDRFDHTSQLRLLETRFGVPVPNLTAWRRSVTGDMTTTFNFSTPPNLLQPNLDHPTIGLAAKLPQCLPNAALGTAQLGIPYRVPYPQTMPTQEPLPARGIPTGPC
jgi:phospholipase C